MPINPTCTLAVKRSNDLAAQVESDQMKDCLTKINADGV